MSDTPTTRPTPETDDFILYMVRTDHNWRKFARGLERQRDEAREQMQAMREAIKEAHEALKELRSFYIEFINLPPCAANAALTKLQPFLKP